MEVLLKTKHWGVFSQWQRWEEIPPILRSEEGKNEREKISQGA